MTIHIFRIYSALNLYINVILIRRTYKFAKISTRLLAVLVMLILYCNLPCVKHCAFRSPNTTFLLLPVA